MSFEPIAIERLWGVPMKGKLNVSEATTGCTISCKPVDAESG